MSLSVNLVNVTVTELSKAPLETSRTVVVSHAMYSECFAGKILFSKKCASWKTF